MTQYELCADTWEAEELAALQEVIESRRFTMGPKVKAFERAFADYHGMKYGVMVNSGSSANLLAVAAMVLSDSHALQAGDEVIVPAIAWSTTYAPLQQYGVKLRVVDVDLQTLNAPEEAVRAAIGPKTKMIASCSVLGNPAPLDAYRRIADEHGLLFMEDNCESVGARLGGKLAGTFGDLSTASFFFSHHISTAEGGMVLTDDRKLADYAKALRAHGWTRDLDDDSELRGDRADTSFELYDFVLPGYNLRPTEFAGAVGCVQLRRLDQMVAARRANMHLFQELFGEDERFIIQKENGESSCFNLTMVLHPECGFERSDVTAVLKEAKIDHRLITGGSFSRHAARTHYDFDLGDGVPQAELAHDRGFFVGNHAADLRPQLENLAAVLGKLRP